MEKHNDEAKAGKARPELEGGTDAVSVSLTGSSFEIDEKRHQTENEHEPGASGDNKDRLSAEDHDEAASGYSGASSHSTERGEVDPENEEIEETVPGRDLDRQLSRVGFTLRFRTNSPRLRNFEH